MLVRTNRIITKTPEEIKIMAEGGKKLGEIKKNLIAAIDVGVSAQDLEKLTARLIKKAGGKPSFKMVTGYSWATCVNVNEGVVHGIPKRKIIFKKGDIISVDVGFYYRGFHTDTSFSIGVKPNKAELKFLKSGKAALKAGIRMAKKGNRIFDISKAIQESLEKDGLTPIQALVGHGIGKGLHEEPQIPCFVTGSREKSPDIPEGSVLAIEVMYTEGKPEIKVAEDEWTISTKDGKIAGLFEETVAITRDGPLVLTRTN